MVCLAVETSAADDASSASPSEQAVSFFQTVVMAISVLLAPEGQQ